MKKFVKFKTKKVGNEIFFLPDIPEEELIKYEIIEVREDGVVLEKKKEAEIKELKQEIENLKQILMKKNKEISGEIT